MVTRSMTLHRLSRHFGEWLFSPLTPETRPGPGSNTIFALCDHINGVPRNEDPAYDSGIHTWWG